MEFGRNKTIKNQTKILYYAHRGTDTITELCKKTENCYRTVARILKLYETMETDAIYQCLNQSGIAQSFVGKNAMFGFFALMNAVSAYDK